MGAAPDLIGFKDAQDRLRTQLGADVTFSVPTDATYDPAVPLDPETGRPFDPFADPMPGTGEPREEVVRAILMGAVTTGSQPRDDVALSPRGFVASDDIALDVAVEDAARIDGAESVIVFERRYKVEEIRPDGFVEPSRMFVYATRA